MVCVTVGVGVSVGVGVGVGDSGAIQEFTAVTSPPSIL
jgi:hypothetical protein